MSGDDDTGEGSASAIVAYEATKRGRPSNVLVCGMGKGRYVVFFFKNDPRNNKS